MCVSASAPLLGFSLARSSVSSVIQPLSCRVLLCLSFFFGVVVFRFRLLPHSPVRTFKPKKKATSLTKPHVDLWTAAATTKGRKTGKRQRESARNIEASERTAAERREAGESHFTIASPKTFFFFRGVSPSSTSDCCCGVLFRSVFRLAPWSAPPHLLSLSSTLVLCSTLSAYAILFLVFVCVVVCLYRCNNPLFLFYSSVSFRITLTPFLVSLTSRATPVTPLSFPFAGKLLYSCASRSSPPPTHSLSLCVSLCRFLTQYRRGVLPIPPKRG